MPTATDLDLARPRCPGKRMIPNPSNKRSAVHVWCFRPLSYHADTNEWECSDCERRHSGGTIAARVLGWVEEEVA